MVYGIVASEPDIGLLSDGGVEVPPSVLTDEFRVGSRITILLTEFVVDAVLACEVKDVDSEPDVLEKGVVFNRKLEAAVIVKQEMLWAVAELVHALDELLKDIRQVQPRE